MYGDDGENLTAQRFYLSRHSYAFTAHRRAIFHLFMASLALGGVISPTLYFRSRHMVNQIKVIGHMGVELADHILTAKYVRDVIQIGTVTGLLLSLNEVTGIEWFTPLSAAHIAAETTSSALRAAADAS